MQYAVYNSSKGKGDTFVTSSFSATLKARQVRVVQVTLITETYIKTAVGFFFLLRLIFVDLSYARNHRKVISIARPFVS